MAIGVLVWAPRHQVPAAPTGLSAQSPTATSVATTAPGPVGLTVRRQTRTTVAFAWSPPPNASVPTQYVIYQGGTPIATVPGTVHAYRAAGLTPGTAYQYRVAAKWGQRESSRSAALTTVTLAPPLQGDVPVQLTTVSTPGSGASLKAGQKWSDTWTFSSACTANRCTLTADAQFAAPGFTSQPFSMTLKFSNARYTGTAEADITKCGSASVKNTITLDIAARRGAIRHGGWTAWRGTLVLSSPYVRASSTTYCAAQSWSFSIASGAIASGASASGASASGASASAASVSAASVSAASSTR